jgi:hypothetical protein
MLNISNMIAYNFVLLWNLGFLRLTDLFKFFELNIFQCSVFFVWLIKHTLKNLIVSLASSVIKRPVDLILFANVFYLQFQSLNDLNLSLVLFLELDKDLFAISWRIDNIILDISLQLFVLLLVSLEFRYPSAQAFALCP